MNNTRFIETPYDLRRAHLWLDNQAMPFVVSVTAGSKRSTAQNRLCFKWYGEIAQQRGDVTAGEVRAECKLSLGIPILRAENEAFREVYDRHGKPLPFDTKLACMAEPMDMAVTSVMTTKQLTAYLDAIHRHYSMQGLELTDPGDLIAASLEVAA